MGGDGGIRVDFINGQSFGTWGHCLTWSGYHAYNMYQLAGYYHVNGASDLWFRSEKDHTNDEWTAWNKIYHTGNDGSGSGLDADTLDGNHASAFALAHSHPYLRSDIVDTLCDTSSSGTLMSRNGFSDFIGYNPSYGSYIGGGAGNASNYIYSGGYISKGGVHTLWHSGNDGSGSGLDADLLDGQHGSYYAPASHSHSLTLSGDVSGSGSVSGTISVTVNNDSHSHSNYMPVSRSASQSSDSFGTYILSKDDGGFVGSKPPGSHNGVGMMTLHTHTGNYYSQLALDTSQNQLWLRSANNTSTFGGWTEIWASNNDGSGSGLDADLLDGQDGSYYAAASHSHPYLPLSGGTVTGATSLRAGGTHLGNHEFASASGTSTGYADAGIEIREGAYGSTASYSAPRLAFHWGGVVASNISIDTAGAILIRNNPGTAYENLKANNFYANGTNIVWNAGNDGSGSGLDADLLDGLHASSFYRSDNPSGYITASHLNDYTNGAYRVIADYSSTNTWYINSRSHFTWARSHDWTLTYDLYIGSGTAGANSGWAELGQRQSNSANGTFRGTRFVRHTDGAVVDGDVRAANYYVNGDTYYFKSGSWGFRHQTPSGYIEFGPANTGTAHIYTDRSSFYFNVNTLLANGNTVWTAGNDGSGSGLDADLLDGVDISRVVHGNGVNRTDGGDPNTLRPSGFYENYQGNSPTGTWYNYINMRHTNAGNGHGHQIAGSFYSAGEIFNRSYSGNGTFTGWARIWNTANDGSGSGLDADLLDGQQPSKTGGANRIAQYNTNGYLYVENWIHLANNTGLFYDNGTHFKSTGAGTMELSDTASHNHIDIDANTNYWKYLSLKNGTSTKWDIATKENDLSGALQFRPSGGNSNVMSLTTAGRLDVRTTAEGCITIHENTGSAGATFIDFVSGTTGTRYGRVYRSYSTTVYATSSDYRLKENVVPLTNALDRVNELSVKRFNFIEHPDRTVDGFIAHEVAAVVPEAVVGEYNEVDEEGNPVHQGIDQSKLVPLLTAALQEAITKIEQLELRINALEN